MEIQMMPVTAITPYEKNPRKNDKAVPKTAESLQQYGFRQPIVVDKDMVIIAGNTSLAGMRYEKRAIGPAIDRKAPFGI